MGSPWGGKGDGVWSLVSSNGYGLNWSKCGLG